MILILSCWQELKVCDTQISRKTNVQEMEGFKTKLWNSCLPGPVPVEIMTGSSVPLIHSGGPSCCSILRGWGHSWDSFSSVTTSSGPDRDISIAVLRCYMWFYWFLLLVFTARGLQIRKNRWITIDWNVIT